jgi:hypothetical protein
VPSTVETSQLGACEEQEERCRYRPVRQASACQRKADPSARKKPGRERGMKRVVHGDPKRCTSARSPRTIRDPSTAMSTPMARMPSDSMRSRALVGCVEAGLVAMETTIANPNAS